MKVVPIGVSGRHIHLQTDHIAALFGEGYELRKLKQLSQPYQYAAEEAVRVEGPRGVFPAVRIVGPARPKTQLELSRTDALALGVQAPIRESGRLDGTPGIRLVGPSGVIELERGVIVAARHIHFHPNEAAAWGIADKQRLQVKLNGERPLVFLDVIARVSDRFALDMHIDTDEANAAGVSSGDLAEIIG
ncbi:phosphate propanoyltransferase [Paenibacillus cymbidii]|uniref:phosphate propanoyltransferase n=1 Tax=Paenibacillus cymbidii TaxID=1639034 RepID=UPI001080AD28|nr:phosphate propanoyltransferase [Paenibacillus cymbidii]